MPPCFFPESPQKEYTHHVDWLLMVHYIHPVSFQSVLDWCSMVLKLQFFAKLGTCIARGRAITRLEKSKGRWQFQLSTLGITYGTWICPWVNKGDLHSNRTHTVLYTPYLTHPSSSPLFWSWDRRYKDPLPSFFGLCWTSNAFKVQCMLPRTRNNERRQAPTELFAYTSFIYCIVRTYVMPTNKQERVLSMRLEGFL